MSYVNRHARGIVSLMESSRDPAGNCSSFGHQVARLEVPRGRQRLSGVDVQRLERGLHELAALPDRFLPSALLELGGHRLEVLQGGPHVLGRELGLQELFQVGWSLRCHLLAQGFLPAGS